MKGLIEIHLHIKRNIKNESKMKRLTFLAAFVLLLLSTNNSLAQTKTGADFFAGKWNVLISGTPIGDLRRIYVLEKNNNTLAGTVQDSTGTLIAKCSKVDVRDNEVTLYYNSMGIDAIMKLTKKDQDHVTGILLDQYLAEGKRIK